MQYPYYLTEIMYCGSAGLLKAFLSPITVHLEMLYNVRSFVKTFGFFFFNFLNTIFEKPEFQMNKYQKNKV